MFNDDVLLHWDEIPVHHLVLRRPMCLLSCGPYPILYLVNYCLVGDSNALSTWLYWPDRLLVYLTKEALNYVVKSRIQQEKMGVSLRLFAYLRIFFVNVRGSQ
jgi:hypothetical protein